MHTIWTGERVRLRPFTSGKEIFVLSHYNNNEVHPILGPMWFDSVSEDKLFEDNGFMDEHGLCGFAIERLDTDQLIGMMICVLEGVAGISAEVGTFIRKEHRGRGFGHESKQLALCFLFENFNLSSVFAWTMETHKKAQQGLLLTGMEYFGRKRRSYLSRGAYIDRVYYSITREQWEQSAIRQVVKRGRLKVGESWSL